MRTVSGAVRGAAVALLTIVAGVATAASPKVLTFDAPESCGTLEQLETRIEDLSGVRLSEQQGEMHVEATVTREADRYVATVHIRSPSGQSERQFSAESCPLARDAIALLVALLINPDATPEDTEPDDPQRLEETEPSEQSPPTTPAVAERQAPPDADERPLRPLAALGLAAGVGHLPRWGAAAQLHLGVATPHVLSLLESRLWLPQSVSLEAVPGGEARFVLGSAALLICASDDRHRMQLRVCGGPALLVESGRASGISRPASRVAVWGAARGGVQGAWRLSPALSAVAALGVDFAPQPQSFSIDGLGAIHRTQSVAPHASLSLQRRF